MNGKCARCGVLAAVLVLVAVPAFASAWSPPLDAVRVLLPFGASYAGKTHHGIDLGSAAGAEVSSPACGTVTFAGSVPADDGGTCVAVTVLTADGLKVTLLPLQSAFVSAGATVSAGEAVGLVAATGDDSSAEPHVHLSIRRGDAYLDPAPFLPSAATPVPPTAPTAAGSESSEGAVTPPPALPSAVATPRSTNSVSAATSVVAEAAPPAVPTATAPKVNPRQLLADADPLAASSLRPDVHYARSRSPLSLGASSPAASVAAVWALLLVGITAATRTRHAAEQVQ